LSKDQKWSEQMYYSRSRFASLRAAGQALGHQPGDVAKQQHKEFSLCEDVRTAKHRHRAAMAG
jgi:hypothetical protein